MNIITIDQLATIQATIRDENASFAERMQAMEDYRNARTM